MAGVSKGDDKEIGSGGKKKMDRGEMEGEGR